MGHRRRKGAEAMSAKATADSLRATCSLSCRRPRARRRDPEARDMMEVLRSRNQGTRNGTTLGSCCDLAVSLQALVVQLPQTQRPPLAFSRRQHLKKNPLPSSRRHHPRVPQHRRYLSSCLAVDASPTVPQANALANWGSCENVWARC